MKTQTIRKSKYQLGNFRQQAQQTEALRQQQLHAVPPALPAPPIGGYNLGTRQVKYGGMKYGARRKYQAGGSMYADNTVQNAGQGATGTTANIVFQESNPELQEQRLRSLEEQKKTALVEGEAIEQELKQEGEQSKIDIQAAEDKVTAMSNTASSGIKSGIELGKQSGVIDKKAGSLGFGDALTAYKASRAAKKTMKGIQGFNKAKQAFDMNQRLRMGESAYRMSQVGSNLKNLKIGTDSTKMTMQGFKGAKQGLDTLKTGTELTKMTKDGLMVASDSTKALSQGSSIGKGLASLNNANVYAAAANYAGKGIKKMSDDDDATTWTAGEAFGDTLSKAGEYAGYGATIGALGGPLAPLTSTAGAVIGGLVGTGVGLYQGFTGRNKARKKETLANQERDVKVNKYNKGLMSDFFGQKARVSSGEMAQKTYSGYDLGRNVIAKRGGYRTLPQYI